MFGAHGGTLLGRSSTDAAFDGEQGGDPLQGLKGNRRSGSVMHVVKFAAPDYLSGAPDKAHNLESEFHVAERFAARPLTAIGGASDSRIKTALIRVPARAGANCHSRPIEFAT